MKYFFILFILSVFFIYSINDVHALLVSEDPVGEMDVVVVGTIVSAVPGTNSYGVPETQYVVDVEEIIKGVNLLEDGINTKSLKFYAPGVLNAQDNPIYRKMFSVNDRALLMLEQKDGLLHASLWSRTTPSSCNGNEIIQLIDAPGGLSIYQDKQDHSPFYTNHPIVAQYSFFNKNLTATIQNVTINVIDDFPVVYHSKSFVLNLDECQAYATATTKFVIDKPSSIAIHTVINEETSDGISGLDVVEYILSPLKQIKSGVSVDEIQCKESLVLLTKHDGSPACVKPETKEKLIERGWMQEVRCNGCDGVKTLDNYKINCDSQTNPYQEYECFKNAYSNCDIATVNPEIYTIHGDTIYTTLAITSDCKIQGVADMSTDKFWGTSEIIITKCDEISRDEYTWSATNCDMRNLSEMQFNFEMQLYPQILECEENDGTWIREKLECVRDKENED